MRMPASHDSCLFLYLDIYPQGLTPSNTLDRPCTQQKNPSKFATFHIHKHRRPQQIILRRLTPHLCPATPAHFSYFRPNSVAFSLRPLFLTFPPPLQRTLAPLDLLRLSPEQQQQMAGTNAGITPLRASKPPAMPPRRFPNPQVSPN